MKQHTEQSLLDKIFKDKDGNIIIGQSPNLPIIIWLVALTLTKISDGRLSDLFSYISFGALFTWAYLEIFEGTNYFRRFLGVAVMVFTLYSKLK